MNGENDRGFIPDPDYENWDGVFIGVKNAPPLTHHLQKLSRYMKKEGKKFEDLTEREIEQFRISGR